MKLPRTPPVYPSSGEMENLMRAASDAADAAAAVTLDYFRASLAVENKATDGKFDPVTLADQEAEPVIQGVLQKDYPDIGFFGEEHEAISSNNGLMWVVDPIDGTRAFMSGMPLWGTLIGLYNGEDAILGLLDQPFLKERYQAYGGSAFMITPERSLPLATRSVAELSQAVAYCTTPDMFSDASARACFDQVCADTLLMRYGGDCYSYALLAAGHIDLVLDCDLKPYDIQALIPLVQAAGGVVTNWDGESAVNGGYVVAAGSDQLHKQVLPLLRR